MYSTKASNRSPSSCAYSGAVRWNCQAALSSGGCALCTWHGAQYHSRQGPPPSGTPILESPLWNSPTRSHTCCVPAVRTAPDSRPHPCISSAVSMYRDITDSPQCPSPSVSSSFLTPPFPSRLPARVSTQMYKCVCHFHSRLPSQYACPKPRTDGINTFPPSPPIKDITCIWLWGTGNRKPLVNQGFPPPS